MGIDIIKTMLNSKTIFKYCLRIFIFFFLCNGHFTTIITLFPTLAILYILSIFKLDTSINETFDDFFFVSAFFYCIYFYLMAKICGIYKKFDNTKTALTIFAMIGIALFFYLYSCIDFSEFPTIIRNSGNILYLLFLPNFFIYKILGVLAKKYTPFKKMGYYTSSEFFKDLFLRIKEKNYSAKN